MGLTATSAGEASYNTGLVFNLSTSTLPGSQNTANGMLSLLQHYRDTTTLPMVLYLSPTLWGAKTLPMVCNLSTFNSGKGQPTLTNGYVFSSQHYGKQQHCQWYDLSLQHYGNQQHCLRSYSGRYLANGTTGRSTGNNGLYLGFIIQLAGANGY